MTVGLTPHVCNVSISQNIVCKNKRATRRRNNAQISVKIEKIDADTAQYLAEIYALLMRFRAHRSPATQRLNNAVGSTVTYGALAHYIHWLICKRHSRSARLTSDDAQII